VTVVNLSKTFETHRCGSGVALRAHWFPTVAMATRFHPEVATHVADAPPASRVFYCEKCQYVAVVLAKG
jgi:hypothetical protein